MSIGLGIFLIALGAIVVYALNFTIDWIDLDLVGYILMAAGVIVLIFGIIWMIRGRRSTVTSRTVNDPVSGEQVTRSERDLPPEI
jgi:uncharacterized membrane protein